MDVKPTPVSVTHGGRRVERLRASNVELQAGFTGHRVSTENKRMNKRQPGEGEKGERKGRLF